MKEVIEQMIVITGKEEKINTMISEGWYVKGIVPQSVSAGSYIRTGDFCFLLERVIKQEENVVQQKN